MANGDKLLRGYAVLSSLKANPPDQYEVEAEWVRQFNAAVETVEQGSGIDLTEFKVPERELYRSVATSSTMTDEVNYRDGLWLRRNALMQRIDAILTYFTGLQGGDDRSDWLRETAAFRNDCNSLQQPAPSVTGLVDRQEASRRAAQHALLAALRQFCPEPLAARPGLSARDRSDPRRLPALPYGPCHGRPLGPTALSGPRYRARQTSCLTS